MIDINNYIDHTLLRPTATTDEIKKLCEEAIANQFKAVCVAPIHIDTAKQSIEKNNVNLCSVVGFPFGYNHIGTKLDEIARAIDSGADELDVVINIGAIKNEDWKKVESEMDSIATATKLKKSKILKFILETA
ncbi:MAG: deoxyribose-phosphate aldolase, partial [Saprospiraceae bacterium]